MDSLAATKASILSQIHVLATGCAPSGGDASDAEPARKSVANRAADFIRALPEGVPLPEVAAEPDGAISLDWITSRTRLFSLSVGASGRLAFAWLDAASKGHGTALFDRETIPPEILEGVKRIANSDSPSR